jgi:GMP synthase-like glutamine amidotransferase
LGTFSSARIGDVSSGELRGLVLQLQEEAPSGLLEPWARRRDIALDVAPIEAGAPDPSQHAFAVVLGSGKSLAQDSPDWARDVLDWVRAADAAQVPVLGICFGAQALAAAFGGSVHRLAAPEIGWVDVTSNDLERVPSGPWLAWHEDGLRPPPLAYELASNRFGTQAFCLRRHLAVQFHPEATADIVARWAAMPHARVEETGQTAEGLVAECRRQAEGAAARAERLFDGFAARAGLTPALAT